MRSGLINQSEFSPNEREGKNLKAGHPDFEEFKQKTD